MAGPQVKGIEDNLQGFSRLQEAHPDTKGLIRSENTNTVLYLNHWYELYWGLGLFLNLAINICYQVEKQISLLGPSNILTMDRSKINPIKWRHQRLIYSRIDLQSSKMTQLANFYSHLKVEGLFFSQFWKTCFCLSKLSGCFAVVPTAEQIQKYQFFL